MPISAEPRELIILNEISKALNQSVELRESLETVLSQVADLLDLKTSWIFLFDQETRKPYLAGALNLPPGLAEHPKLLDGWCYCLDSYFNRDLDDAANVNVITCSRLRDMVDGTNGLRYHSSIPLYANDKKLGVLNVAGTDWRELTDKELRLLNTVGDLLSIAIERSRLYERSVETGAMHERNRLAREIHDTLTQGLAAITLQLETTDALLESGAETGQIIRGVRQALSTARRTLEEARRSILDLRAAPLRDRSLVEALEELKNDFTRKHGLDVALRVVGNARALSVRAEMGFYRIVQEALNNIVQHAEAKRVELHLRVALENISLTIKDDGKGFDAASISEDRFGLIGINERANLLHGTMETKSAPGQGTEIRVTVPRTAV